jgi:hypothetical protein
MSNLSRLSIALYLAIVGCYFFAAMNSGHIQHLIYSKGLSLQLLESNMTDENKSDFKVSDYIEIDSQGREFITPENMDKIQASQNVKRKNIIRRVSKESKDNKSVSLSNKFIALMCVFLILLIFFDSENIKPKIIFLSVLLVINLFVVQYSLISLIFVIALVTLFVKECSYWFFPRR